MRNIMFKCALTVCALTASVATAGGNCYPVDCDPCCNQSNFNVYIGGALGVGSHTAHRNDLDEFLSDHSGWSTISTGFLGGGQIGVDWTRCNALVGLVADINATGLSHKLRHNPNDSTVDQHLKNDFGWITTLRARAGLSVCNALVYVTAGGARVRFAGHWKDGEDTFKHRYSQWGWTGGAGTEFKLGCNFSLGLELLYAHFDDKTRRFESSVTPGSFFTVGASNSVWLGKLMINYNFGDFSSLCCW